MNVKAVIYWLVVALPLSWGLYKAIEKSVPLFSDNAPAAPAAKVIASPAPEPAATPAAVVAPSPASTVAPTATPTP